MKRNLLIALITLCTGMLFAQPQANEIIEPTNDQKGEVIFIRDTGIFGSLVPYKAFLDDELVCRLNNKRFSKHKLESGQHQFSVQYYGKKRKAKYTPVDIEVNEGKAHYILLVQKVGFWQSKIKAVEISEDSAKAYLERINKEDKKY